MAKVTPITDQFQHFVSELLHSHLLISVRLFTSLDRGLATMA